jgi:hypothetical protein
MRNDKLAECIAPHFAKALSVIIDKEDETQVAEILEVIEHRFSWILMNRKDWRLASQFFN